MNRKAITSAILAFILSAGMSVTAAAYNPLQAMEDESHKAVATAISEGKIPSDATIFDCAYSSEKGVTRVIQYRDASGVWIDVTTGASVPVREDAPPKRLPAPVTVDLSEEALAEYADEVYRLTNEAREKAGVPLLEWDAELFGAADERAGECASLEDIRVNGQSHKRPDGSSFATVLSDRGIEWPNGAGENSASGQDTPQIVTDAWMASSGHRANMLDETWTRLGVGVRMGADGNPYWIQLLT
jgi:uncharacterized protein YkwD